MAVADETYKFLRGLPFFAALPETMIQRFVKAGRIVKYTKKQNIFLKGDTADRLFVVLGGWVKLYSETNEGEEAVVALFKRGDVFGEAAIFGNAGYPFAAEAAEETRIIEISGDDLRAQARENHEVMVRIMDSMSREMRNLQMENEHLALMSAPQRVGCLLLQLSAGMIGKGGTFSFPYDKSLAAARLGMKPETFSRALAQLKPVGITVNGPEVTVDSFSTLVDYCCSHCSALPGECAGTRGESCERASTCPGKKLIQIGLGAQNRPRD
ncbi:MAG: Crp/Fnr family transcriptional regulator [Alphaproteobacteria bacterium]|nr:Crp/Fnr family transcriptional regulator [Alphaproteobacteria bacterium]